MVHYQHYPSMEYMKHITNLLPKKQPKNVLWRPMALLGQLTNQAS